MDEIIVCIRFIIVNTDFIPLMIVLARVPLHSPHIPLFPIALFPLNSRPIPLFPIILVSAPLQSLS